ncbi:hypothetical protein Dbac_1359 [Desulfomicrobium baculatum DSM 4028]|uniref:Uncharacterized protein n=1 Tax=Desulfomicrobium baculatum (strain DSM 4028 / VKM B-1378 / X) TaxID=525897 RepID=C7LSR5_DESBD|nr:hypothetical protein Dbac_1359 [Desulfomicrobium baculatum DSM 4028]
MLLLACIGPGHEASFHDTDVCVPGAFQNALGFVAAALGPAAVPPMTMMRLGIIFLSVVLLVEIWN